MSKIIVTGGAGFIGSHTVVELYRAGFEPIIIDDFSNSEKSVLQGIENIIGTSVSCYAADCNNQQVMDTIFAHEKNITGIIHFAAFKAVGESVQQPVKYYRNNLNSLLVMMEMMITHKVPHLVFSSSCTVYGQPEVLPVNEQSPILPAQSPYGNTKQLCEQMIEQIIKAGKPLKAISLRYFNPIGAHPSGHIGELPIGIPGNLVPFITQTAAGLRPMITVFGNDYNTSDGTCVRDYIHVVDLAKAHVKALELLDRTQDSQYYDVFNVGTGAGNTVLEVIKTFEIVTGRKLNYKIGPRRSGDIEKIYAEVDKARDVLRWQSGLTLRDALKDAWNWQQKLQNKAETTQVSS
jgi:UDP-glucose 4-epimerase